MVDAQTKKLEIIERVLHLENEQDLLMVDELLEAMTAQSVRFDDIPPMPFVSEEEMTAGIREAEADINAGRTYTQEEVKAIVLERYKK